MCECIRVWKQNVAYEIGPRDLSSDVRSCDLMCRGMWVACVLRASVRVYGQGEVGCMCTNGTHEGVCPGGGGMQVY